MAVPVARLAHGAGSSVLVDLPGLAGERLPKLPLVLRLLLENVARTASSPAAESGVDAILDWLVSGTSTAEVPICPGRILMHDTTSTPALVDLAAMRDALAEAGADPTALSPTVPVDISVDHSLAVETYGHPNAATINLAHEFRRNSERYRFLRWAASTLPGVRIHPPGTGIMHTINIEQLATVITTERRGDDEWAVPDLMIGTDSHTPMVNGIGVLAWGVGGLEAETVMFGMPTVVRVPDVVGVRLVGRLNEMCTATDLALTVTQHLRALGVAGDFVEFFGAGVSTLTAGERCVVANMAPEYGAATGYFGIDAQTLAYLRATGRDPAAIQLVESYARRNGLWFDPRAEPRFTRVTEIDLGAIGQHVAGPQRPQDLLPYWATAQALDASPPANLDAQPLFPIVIAAVTSCTNTSDPRLLIAAGLLARKARAAGLSVPAWVKTSLSPGSPAAARYLARAGLDEDLAALGFNIVGYGCATCIGNSGPLPSSSAGEASRRVAVLSGNRNFPGRIHPELDLAFIMSPPLVVAFALAGDAARNLRDQPVQVNRSGRAVKLQELWPAKEEIERTLRDAIDPGDFGDAFAVASRNTDWHALPDTAEPRFSWNPRSTILRRPPFASVTEGSLLGRYTAYPLLVLGDDVTTDHISPASAIPKQSGVADFLVNQGEDRDDLNVFASRRGNWEVMLRGTFYHRTLKNLLASELPAAHTVHVPSGDVMPIWQAAARYRDAADSVVLVAGERYGTGSSRDWAAKGPRLLGIRAVIAGSFERIHRTNLIGMGILPLQVQTQTGSLDLAVGDRIEVDAKAELIAPACTVPIHVLYRDGRRRFIETTAAIETSIEVELLREGGLIPHTLRAALRAAA